VLLPRSWESFIQGICSRRKLTKFSRLWEDCTQEEARMVAREEKLGDDDQALAAHTKKGKSKAHSPRRFQKFQKGQRDYSNFKCYGCQEMGHIKRNCPHNKKEQVRKGKYKRHHAHATEDDELVQKKRIKEDDSDEEYVLISALTGMVTHGSDTWLVDSGASKHMTGYKDSLSSLVEKDSPHKMKLGDDYQYPIKGVGEASYRLDSGSQ
jgi:hypothetical protein